MDAVRLKMNESKTEFMLLGSREHLKKCTTNSLKVLGENIEKSEVIRYLGGYLDSTVTFKQHIKTMCKCAMLNLLKIINIRKYLDRDTAHSIIMSSTPGLHKQSPDQTTRQQYKTNAESPKHGSKSSTQSQ